MKDVRQGFILKPAGKRRGAVLLLHGFSASPWEVYECGRHLSKRGYLVHGPALAGHGSTREAFDACGADAWIAGAESEFQKLKKLSPIVNLIGHSAGGVLAAILAARHPESVKSLVMGAPAFKLADPFAPLLRFPPLRLFIQTLNFPSKSPESKYWTTSYASHRIPELMRLGRLGREAALGLKLPILLMQARGDDQTSRPFNEALFREIPSQKKSLRIYETAEHNVFHHSNPLQQQVFAWLDAFLKSA